MTSKTAILFTHNGQDITSEQAFEQCELYLTSASDKVICIFFYFNSVNILAEHTLFKQWGELKQQYQLRLLTCSTAAHNRKLSSDISGPFELTGLSEFYEQLHHCDKLVQL